MNHSLGSRDFCPETEIQKGQGAMRGRSPQLRIVASTTVAGIAALCLSASEAAASTGGVLAACMGVWGAAGLAIIGSLTVLTLTERVAPLLRGVRSSLRVAAHLRALAFTR
jgi:hypothetical protein